ncbi:MAG: pyridine nucleotide-disulfide oxidoreductase [Candidatus Lokiarchaeota archaeon]|nr:pyridine nucleotide-disulfide oxidoreductase [Candidatus Lokiarchaeota archaeon]
MSDLKMEKVIIVGGVAGGASAAARLRRLREDLEITVLERGPFVSFANCGLPYYIGQVIKEERRLKLMTPKRFLNRFNINVKVDHEVRSIDETDKKVTVIDLKNGNTLVLDYDYLILSPGASPIIPPFPGINDVPFFTIRNIPDSNRIIQYIEDNEIKHATIVGGGFIGLEMAENLRYRGVKVKIVEMLDQVMAPLDREIAQFIHQELLLNGVCLQLEDPIESFKTDSEGNFYVVPRSGNRIKTDMVILAMGVKPENHLAKDAGLEIGPKGHIIVDEQMRTSDPSIFAVGDAIQIKNYVTKQPTGVPLAGPANKQGRIVADVIAGRKSKYKGVLGASVVKIFDITVSSVGLNEKELKQTDIKYEKIYVHPNNHAGYYPGAVPITLKLIFETPNGRILGAQAVGGSGTEKRIDVISTVMKFNGTVFDLEELELTYAPPYGSAKDPVNMAGFVASNVLRGDMPIWHWNELSKIKEDNSVILDVRTPGEYEIGSIDGAININDLELRNRLNEVPKDKNIYIYCEVGFRAYLATRFLNQMGYNVKNLAGGYKLYKTAIATTEEIAAECGTSEEVIEEFIGKNRRVTEDYVEIDASGLACPGPLNALIKSLETLPENKQLKIYATDPGFKASVEAYAKLNETVKLLSLRKEEGKLVAMLEKGISTYEEIKAPVKPEKKTRKQLRVEGAPPLSDINATELYERIDSDDVPAIMIDVRTPQEYHGKTGHIKNSKLMPLGELMYNVDELEKYKDEEIVVICHSGSRSMMAAQILARAGFKDVRNLTGGMIMWHRKGYPVENGGVKSTNY